MNHIICLTKSYKLSDFTLWYKWHKTLGFAIHIFDNESTVDIKSVIQHEDDYELIEGWPDQWNLYNRTLRDNKFNFVDGDIVLCIDDDEFVYMNNCTLEEFIDPQLDCTLIPEILISTKNFMNVRNRNLIEHAVYRRTDLSSQGKAMFVYKSDYKYNFAKKCDEIGHVPFINNIRMSNVVGSGLSKTTYGLVAYEAPLRLYHYHIKSLEDWVIKFERGSAANKTQIYDRDVRKNWAYGRYEAVDLSMLQFAKEKGLC